MVLTVRLTVPDDASAIDTLTSELYGTAAGAARLLETTLLCITVLDNDELLGFLCLDHVACLRLGCDADGAMGWVRDKAGPRESCASAFVRVAAFHPDFELEAAAAALRACFLTVPSLGTLLLATDYDIAFKEPGLGGAFECVTRGREEGTYLYEAPRSMVVPTLTVRAARVEDHDDLVPLMAAGEVRYPALARLPEACNPGEPFALTRLVTGQDESNVVLVASDGEKLVGFMVVTSDVDPASLLAAFDLHPYDNFLPSDEYDIRYGSVAATARNEKRARLVADLEEKKVASAAAIDAGEAYEGDANEWEQPGFDIEAQVQLTDDEIRAAMAANFPPDPDDATTLFAITMFCMAEGAEEQASEFLRAAFEAFSKKEYVMVTLPYGSAEPPLLGCMARLSPLPGASFPEVPYLFNRNALLPGFEVRLATPCDAPGVAALVDGMPNAEVLCDVFKRAAESKTAVVASVGGEVVGIATISDQGVDLSRLAANFELGALVDLGLHLRAQHGEIDIYCMNPIFAHRHRDLLAGVQRLLSVTCLYYALPPGQAPPDMLDCLAQVPPRHRAVPAEQQAEFALYMLTRRGAYARKRSVNAQLVVVGASETGLAAVERMLLDPLLSFNYITLLAPGGVPVGGPACEFTGGLVARLGLEARVTLVDAELVGLDAGQRLAELSDGGVLSYDLLLLTCGLQEQTRATVGEADPEVAGAVVNVMELNADFTLEDAARMLDIVVYGDSLEAYHALSVLERRAASDAVRFLAPPGDRTPLAKVLRAAAGVLGIGPDVLPAPRLLTLSVLQSREGSARPQAFFEGPGAQAGNAEDMSLDLLVGCRPPDVSPWVFACLNDAGIVYDGRVVVDACFRTSDASIYAAGTCAKLTRAAGDRVAYEHYNSREVGHALAASVSSLCSAGTPAPAAAPAASASAPPPPLRCARVVGCDLPGGYTFLYAGAPSALQSPSLDAPADGRQLRTVTQWGLMQLTLCAASRVHSAVYLGKPPDGVEMPASKIGSLVGLHSNYLNDLVSKFDAGAVPDLVLFFSEPWAELVHHDRFGALRASLLEPYMVDALASGEADADGMGAHVRDAVLAFVKARLTDFPSYNVPATA
ncbi:hypothetical protein FOA52_013916 [Chlamydomonas sp. UWO 241]|nr:hypothetical protein FOA52_013916 [Chlamydomonas sp. UWO 241]